MTVGIPRAMLRKAPCAGCWGHATSPQQEGADPATGQNTLRLPKCALGTPSQCKPLESHDLVTKARVHQPARRGGSYGEDDEALHALAVGGAAWRNRASGGSGNRGDTRCHVEGQNRRGYLRPPD